MKYYLSIAAERNTPFPRRILGPFDTHGEAWERGKVFASELVDVEIHGDEIVCDFCSSPEVEWRYRAVDFGEVMSGWASRGDWAACTECRDLIEAGKWKELAEHSLVGFEKKNPEQVKGWTQQNRNLFLSAIREIHKGFQLAREGEVEREAGNRE